MSPFRDRVFQADSHENHEEKPTQLSQNSSPLPETLDDIKDIVEPEPQPNNEQNKSEDESRETDSELTQEFSYRGTADVDICAEELNKMETVEEQVVESVQEPASVEEENETAEKEPVTLSSYRGLADVDVCSKELQSTLQEEEPTVGNGDISVTGAGFIPPSESPEPVLAEQDVLDIRDESIPSGNETSVYVEEDVGQKLNDISYSEQAIASPVKEDEIRETGHLSEDVREMTNTLFDDAGPEIHNVEQLHLNEGAESVSVSEEAKTFDETNTDEIPLGAENQQANDILAAEAMSESSFILEKASLAHRSSEDRPGMEDLMNVESEVQEENSDCESVTDVNVDGDERDSQTDMKEDETNDDKQPDPQDTIKTVPVEDMEGLMDSNLNPTGFSVEDMDKDDTSTSQQDDYKVQDPSEIDKGNNSLNTPETQEDNLFYSTFTHESKGTLPIPTSEETEQDVKHSATDSEELTEEPETVTDYEESQNQEDMVREPIFESENKGGDQQVRCRNSVFV